MHLEDHIGPKQHLLILGSLLLGELVLACAPNAVLRLQYQCMLQRLTGLRCPFCGMTRDFILMFHGFAPRNNPGSFIVAIVLYIAYPWWILAAMVGKDTWLYLERDKVLNALAIVGAILMICNNLFVY
jgi:hypothetical protein